MISLDAYEIKDEFIVKAELPGVQKENLDISLDGDMLRIEAQRMRWIPSLGQDRDNVKSGSRCPQGIRCRDSTIPPGVASTGIEANTSAGVI